jgi:hypothetical protein
VKLEKQKAMELQQQNEELKKELERLKKEKMNQP